jgi:uncharacterized protein (TIGR02996 family)
MSDAAAFLAKIIAEPADDLPRLVYADWLDERGDPRGEFIRVQVELAGYTAPCPGVADFAASLRTPGVCSCRSCALRRRERELLTGRGGDWSPSRGFVRGRRHGWRLAESGPTVEWSDRTAVTFARGFVSSVTLSWADWQRHWRAIRASAPVTDLTLTNTMGSHAGTVAETCHGLKRLTIRGGGSDFMRWVAVVTGYLPHVTVVGERDDLPTSWNTPTRPLADIQALRDQVSRHLVTTGGRP